MGARSSGREAALQMLFAIDSAGHDVGAIIHDFWREFPGEAEGRPYADELVQGVVKQLAQADTQIAKASQHWRLERMAVVDRNILRLATWELLHKSEVPKAVIIDEAVELAKRYGNENSGSFVNGVLSRVADDCGRTT
ncbi:MAG TPA: transcription antitermination factor NusB [Polyangiaceae bacterium]|jgi:N utilization substance protein B|nr:transcription antitermination factor NusB [Polyangiaceae bacterium]